MKLMEITKALPDRDETFKIVDWSFETLLVNPSNIQFVSFVKEIDRCVVTLTNGSSIPIKECQEVIQSRFFEATR